MACFGIFWKLTDPGSPVTDVKLADFILAHGTECVNGAGGADTTDEERAGGAIVTPLEDMRAMLAEAAKLRLPMIVANPDFVTVGGGSLLPMPGTLARWYAECLAADDEVSGSSSGDGGGGGGVGGHELIQLMGKPAPVIYRRMMEMTGARLEETIAVGDSLEHDVAGAAGAGCGSVFVCGGIHAEDLGMSNKAGLTAADVGDGENIPPPTDDDVMQNLLETYGVTPEYAVPVFRW